MNALKMITKLLLYVPYTISAWIVDKADPVFTRKSRRLRNVVSRAVQSGMPPHGFADTLDSQYPHVSHAPDNEDILLYKLLHNVEDGFYVDVGADDPAECSVTRFFYARGWRGINIEPRRDKFDRLRQERSRDVNLNLAAASESTVRYREKTVHTETLSRILDDNPPPGDIHFLKVDVDGHEKPVFEGMDFSRYRPWVIVADAGGDVDGVPRYKQWEPVLVWSGYEPLFEHRDNRYYAARERKQQLLDSFLAVPVVPFLKKPHYDALRGTPDR